MRTVDRLAHLERLSSLDAAFLELETPATPMHIGSVSYLEGGHLRDRRGRIRLADLARFVDERLDLAPRFRQMPAAAPFGLGHPVWVDSPSFDVTDHLYETVLPPPGSERQLRELCAHLMMSPLPRSKPLWELWLVDGYGEGGVVLIEKVHHVMMDGVSGIDVAMLTTDSSPTVEHFAAPPHEPSRPDRLTLLAAGLADELSLPLALLGAPWRAAGVLAGAAANPERAAELTRELGTLGRGVLSLLRGDTLAPRTPLNQPVGGRRRVEHVEWPLESMRGVARAFGCTVNDVALAAVTSGLRRLFLSRGEDPGERFQVVVPVSTRGAAGHLTLGNQVAAFLVPLPVGVADTAEQLVRVAEITRERKAQGQAGAVAAVASASDRWPTPVRTLVARLGHRQPFANAVVTNVPGPPSRRYLLGARIRRIVPLLGLAGNLDVSVAILSYDGEVSFGCVADAGRCGDLPRLMGGILAGLKRLDACASRRAAAA